MNFQEFYNQQILPFEAEYEAERQVQLSQKKKWLRVLAAIDIAIVIVIVALADLNDAIGAIVMTQFMLLLVIAGIYQGGFLDPHKNWALQWKKRIYPLLVDCVSRGAAVYSLSLGHTKDDLDRSCLFETEPEKVVSGNMIEGRVNGFSYRFSQIQKSVAYIGSESETEVFKGFFLEMEVPAPAGFVLLLLPKWNRPRIKLEKLDLEHSILNSQFNVYTRNRESGKTFLTPVMCDRLLSINAITRLPVRIGFIDEKIYLAFDEIPYFSDLPVDMPLRQSGLEYDFWLIGQMIGFVEKLQAGLTP